jgi:hypothetical protein
MITFNNLGNLGRLGNQMFQYASLKGISANRGFDFCIPSKESFGSYDLLVRNSDANIYDLFNLDKKNLIGVNNNPIIHEKFFHFDEDLFNNCPDNIDLHGYYQSQKYFEKIEKEIREDFKFSDSLLGECKLFFESSFDSEVISLHIRRGDYLNLSHHPVQTLEYYEQSLNQLPQDIPVIIFSNDYDWCKNQKLFEPDRFLMSENNSTEVDFCLMTLCNYHIIANSSFSWWGSWLSESKKTIAPKNWFADTHINYNVQDLYLDGWVIL